MSLRSFKITLPRDEEAEFNRLKINMPPAEKNRAIKVSTYNICSSEPLRRDAYSGLLYNPSPSKYPGVWMAIVGLVIPGLLIVYQM